jgi:Fe-S-cluster containining protein
MTSIGNGGMEGKSVPMKRDFDLTRKSFFSFHCSICSRCCRQKGISVDPYEVLRLSRNLNMSTTEFYRRFTELGGVSLRQKPDETCVFLTDEGCRVHGDRPRACRLYPLGRMVDWDGNEWFARMPLAKGCEGLVEQRGIVAEYLTSQHIEPYIAFGEMYKTLYLKMVSVLARVSGRSDDAPSVRKENPEEDWVTGAGAGYPYSGEGSEPLTRGLSSPWLDPDAVVENYCRRHNLSKRFAVEELVPLHIRAVEEWLESF